MKKNFLDIVKKERGDSNYAGDQHGGAAGMSGRGLPDGFAGNFMFATGIECSYPTIHNGKTRRDLLKECGHYERSSTKIVALLTFRIYTSATIRFSRRHYRSIRR